MRELIQAEQALGDYTRKHARHIIAGVLGNNAGTVDHATRTNFVYVRLHGDANQVVEAEAIASFPHTAGIVVAVELIKRNAASRYQVLGIASNILYVGSVWAGTVGAHADQHQRRDLGQGGFDPLDIYNRALVNLRGRAQATPDFTLYVERGFYFIGGALYEWTGGNSAAFTVPAGSFGVTVRRCDLLYIGSDQALHIVQGATTSDGSVPAYPTTPYPCIPIAYVYLTSSMASIEEDNIKDARVILTASDGTPVAHNLLSATHGDTLTASVVAGDLIIGNDTPKWSRLAITVPAANVRNVVGVDNGETKPSWKTALDATAPADIANAAAAGTSLVFSHRDHAHRGVVSVNKNGGATLYGAVTLSEGTNITLTQAGQDIAIAAAGGGHTIQDEGTPLTARANLNFVGAGVTVTDDAGNDASVVTIPAGGAHNILSATHTDTLADTVVDGDVIIGNATPKWSRLAISVPAANVRNVLGIDNGELRPSWKTALDATAPTTIGVSDVAAAGTSLVFSHRDHQHGSPATFPATAHNVFSTTHGDTTGAASPVDGDIIIGNVTPAWSKLAISIPAAGTLNYLGVNNGELRPSWKSASSNPGAAAAILATASDGSVALTVSSAIGGALIVAQNLHYTVSANISPTAINSVTSIEIDNGITNTSVQEGVSGVVQAIGGSGTLGSFWGGYFRSNTWLLFSGTVTNLYGVYATTDRLGGTVQNAYSLYVDGPTGTITNKYAIYQATASVSNYFASPANFNAGLNIAGGTVYTAISSAPGAAAAILATDASGNVAVQAVSTGSSATKWGSGTAFPGSPGTGDRFFRTDLGWLCYYDGAQWLTENEYSFLLETPPYSQFAANGDAYFGTFRTDYAPYITRVACNTYVAATNDGSNYWTVLTRGANLAVGAWTNVDSFTTAADTVATRTLHEHAPSVTATPANKQFIEINVAKTLNPGTLTVNLNLFYRLIVT